MPFKRSFALLCSLGIFLSTFVSALPAQALTVSPVKLELRGDPGTTVGGSFRLINEQEKEMSFYVSFANFEAEGESGTPKFVDSGTDLASWIRLLPDGLNSITLEPGASQEVNYDIDIPEDASPGGHFAAIFWGTNPEGDGSEESLSLGAKVGILTFLTVNGDFSTDAGLVEFDTSNSQRYFNELPVAFYYRFQNGGGDRVVPQGDLVIKDLVGLTAAQIPANPSDSNILPMSTRHFDVAWGDATAEAPSSFWDHVTSQWHHFAFGYYHANLALNYSGGSTESSVGFWVLPWQLLSILSLVGVVLLCGGTFLLRRYNRWIIAQAVGSQNAGMHSTRVLRSKKK